MSLALAGAALAELWPSPYLMGCAYLLALFLVAIGIAAAFMLFRLGQTFERLSSLIKGTERDLLPAMLRHIDALSSLSPAAMRQWVTETHSIELMTDDLLSLLRRVIDGGRFIVGQRDQLQNPICRVLLQRLIELVLRQRVAFDDLERVGGSLGSQRPAAQHAHPTQHGRERRAQLMAHVR